VTAGCLAAAGHEVTGLDFDGASIDRLLAGELPVEESGLDELLRGALADGTLRFTVDPAAAGKARVVWVTYDTPVDEDDRADAEFVLERVRRVFPYLRDGQEVLVSSQLPVGSVHRLESDFASVAPGVHVRFACSPENLRLGTAISVFRRPDRIVIGTRADASRETYRELLSPFTEHIEWMSVESAEMTKHALNAFLATSVTFINEIAVLCEQVGADAGEVERGLKSEARIGARAYLAPGGAFAGGTLARDLAFLSDLGEQRHVPLHLLRAVRASNDEHKAWWRRRLLALLGGLQGRVIAIWGLTYKAGTNTLRRSASLELGLWLLDQGASVRVHDPAVHELPAAYAGLHLFASAAEALQGADALVVATAWAEYRSADLRDLARLMRRPLVLDVNHVLRPGGQAAPGVQIVTVGKAVEA
jgi:UDPglucose 6-dehydrogenase